VSLKSSSKKKDDSNIRQAALERDGKRVKQCFGPWMPNKSEKLRDLCLILAGNGTIVTVAHKH